MYRRTFLQAAFATPIAAGVLSRAARGADSALAVEKAHAEIWRRFIDEHGVMVDFTDLDGSVNRPTPQECRDGKPNALGWYQPIENGAMFTGLYMDAALNRWRHTKAPEDAAKARRLMDGLLLLNSISQVKGFVGRGVSTDGKSHYPMGSEDQTGPWFYGLWRYLDSGLATKSERERIVTRLVETADVIVGLGWRMPADPPFGTRGSFAGFHFDHAVRQLFVMKMMYKVTGNAKWDEMYRAALQQRGEENCSRLETCRGGLPFQLSQPLNGRKGWHDRMYRIRNYFWTSSISVAALRGLWEMEEDPELKSAFAEGLEASAALAAKSLSLATQFDPNDKSAFSQDWRKAMLPLWKPQRTTKEAVALALKQMRAFEKISPRRKLENQFIREPCAAAFIVTLCPDAAIVKGHAAEIERLISHFDYTKLYYCTFFWVESAWWRLAAVNRREAP